MKLVIRTRGNSSPKGKGKVFLAILPEDIPRLCEEIVQDLLEAGDVAVYYISSDSDNMIENAITINEDELTDYVLSCGMCVFTVTSAMLSGQNIVKDVLLKTVAGKTPYIPIIFDEGLLEDYGDVFGNIQFMDPYGYYKKGDNEISYKDKLKVRFEEIFVSDEDRANISNAFRAMLFLSYRKVDRHEAQKLMELLHSDPECENVGIWYDEFLVPGEDFNEAIRKAMREADCVVLNVTNNLLEMWNGEPNYVMAHEYPNARLSGKPIISVEMSETDRDTLRKEYEGIEDRFVPKDSHDRVPVELLNTLSLIKDQITKKHSESTELSSNEKEYYIGLAYLSGTNTERNVFRGKSYLEKAATGGMVKAMKRLAMAYKNGELGEIQMDKAAEWFKNAFEVVVNTLSDKSAIHELNLFKKDMTYLWDMYDSLGDETGQQYCRDIVNRKLKPLLETSDLNFYYTVLDILLECTYRSNDLSFCAELLESAQDKANENPDIFTYRWQIEAGCTAAKRMGRSDFIKGAGNYLKEIETNYRNKISDEELAKTYYNIAYACQVDFFANYNGGAISRKAIEKDAPSWTYIDKGLQLCQEHLEKEVDSKNWKANYADFLAVRGKLICKCLAGNYQESEEIAPLESLVCDSYSKAVNLYEDILSDETDIVVRKHCIEEMRLIGNDLVSTFPNGRPVVEGVRYNRNAIRRAESIYEEQKNRENLLYLWKTIQNSCGKNRDTFFSDIAIKIAKELDEIDHTPVSQERIAYSYARKAELLFRTEDDLRNYVLWKEKVDEYKNVMADYQADPKVGREDDCYRLKKELRKIEDLRHVDHDSKKEKIIYAKKAIEVYREIYDGDAPLSKRFSKRILEELCKTYSAFPISSPNSETLPIIKETLNEGLTFMEEMFKKDSTILPWDWFYSWMYMFDRIIDIIKNEADTKKCDELEERRKRLRELWVSELDSQALLYISNPKDELRPEWSREEKDIDTLKKCGLIHLRYFACLIKRDYITAKLILSDLENWIKDKELVKNEEHRFVFEHFKHLESMDGQSDLELCIKLNGDAIELGFGIPKWQGDLLMKQGKEEEALTFYRKAQSRDVNREERLKRFFGN